MIETLPFEQTKPQYFRLILETMFHKRWWLVSLVLIIGLANFYFYLQGNKKAENIIWGLLCLFYPVLLYCQARWFVYSRKNALIFVKRKLYFDKEKMKFELENGATDEVPFHILIEVKDRRTYWMLYIAKGQFLYVPKDIFYSEEDFLSFSELINC